MPGTTECLIILGVVVLLFGAEKLPRLGGSIGEAMKNLKNGLKADDLNENKEIEKTAQEKDTKTC